MKVNKYAHLTTHDGQPYDPEKHFVRNRGGKLYVYDKQIRRWQRERKHKGELKNSVNYRNKEHRNENLLKKMGFTG